MKKITNTILIIFLASFSLFSQTSSTINTTQCNSYIWNGVTYTNTGNYSYTYLNSSGVLQTDYLNLTINYSSFSTLNTIACNAYTWGNGTTYTQSGQYTYTTSNTFGCDSVLTLNLSMNNGVRISPKVFLSGAYDPLTELMKDSLRAAVSLGNPTGSFPIPYLTPPHIPLSPVYFLPTNGVSTSNEVLSVSGNNAIVDWIFIEIRDGLDYNVVVATKHALLQRDGDVVDIDGFSSLLFPTVCPGNYYISIKHRNHLGVMSSTTYNLNASAQLIDFTSGNHWTKPGINIQPQKFIDGVYALWAGDIRRDKNVKYNGIYNDKEYILFALPGYPYSLYGNTIYGYRNEDVNMDGKVRYATMDNDKNFILDEIISSSQNSSPNDIIRQHTPN